MLSAKDFKIGNLVVIDLESNDPNPSHLQMRQNYASGKQLKAATGIVTDVTHDNVRVHWMDHDFVDSYPMDGNYPWLKPTAMLGWEVIWIN